MCHNKRLPRLITASVGPLSADQIPNPIGIHMHLQPNVSCLSRVRQYFVRHFTALATTIRTSPPCYDTTFASASMKFSKHSFSLCQRVIDQVRIGIPCHVNVDLWIQDLELLGNLWREPTSPVCFTSNLFSICFQKV